MAVTCAIPDRLRSLGLIVHSARVRSCIGVTLSFTAETPISIISPIMDVTGVIVGVRPVGRAEAVVLKRSETN